MSAIRAYRFTDWDKIAVDLAVFSARPEVADAIALLDQARALVQAAIDEERRQVLAPSIGTLLVRSGDQGEDHRADRINRYRITKATTTTITLQSRTITLRFDRHTGRQRGVPTWAHTWSEIDQIELAAFNERNPV